MATPTITHIARASKILLLTGLLVGVTASTMLLASCSGDTTTTTSPPTTNAVTDPAPIADGQHFGFVRDLGDGTMTFDPAEFLSGEAALNAAREDGAIGAGEDLPNDFYIRNPDPETVELTVDATADFTLIGLDASDSLTDLPATFEELSRFWDGTEDATTLYGFMAGDLPMTVTVAGGLVTGGTQVYLP